jgi:hypothetical protein
MRAAPATPNTGWAPLSTSPPANPNALTPATGLRHDSIGDKPYVPIGSGAAPQLAFEFAQTQEARKAHDTH